MAQDVLGNEVSGGEGMLETWRTWDPDGVPLNRALAEARTHLLQSPA